MYIVARGRLKVGDAYREVGDPLPEAATWPNLLAYLHGGWITEVSDDAAPTPASSSATPEVEERPAEPPAQTSTDAESAVGVEQTAPADVASVEADEAGADGSGGDDTADEPEATNEALAPEAGPEQRARRPGRRGR